MGEKLTESDIRGGMVDFLNTTGKRVRILRQDLRMNQGTLIHELGKQGIEIGQTYISKIENNDVVPSGRVIAGLAQVLQTTTDYLLLLTDDPLRPGEEEEPEEDQPEPLSPEMQARLERLEQLPEAERQFILRTMDDLMRFAEGREQVSSRESFSQRESSPPRSSRPSLVTNPKP